MILFTTTNAIMSCRRVVFMRAMASTRAVKRSFTSVASVRVDPSKLVHGVTLERMEKDPELAAFIRANYPEAFESAVEGSADDEINIDIDALLGRKPKVTKSKQMERQQEMETGYAKRVDIVYPRNIRPLHTYLRDPVREDGTRNSKKLRYHQGLIPGLLLGSNPDLGILSHAPQSKIFVKTPWPLLQRELDRYHRSFESRVYDLTVLESTDDDSGGTVHRVTPQNVQRHPVMGSIYCANFVRYHPGRPLKLPIRYINQEESAALKREGFIVPIKRYVECFVEDGVDIPENIDLECTGLRVKEVIRVGRIVIPDGVRISDRVRKLGDDFIIGVVYGKNKGDEDADADAKTEGGQKAAAAAQKAADAEAKKKAAAAKK
jgi:predicted nucleotidyltransferase